jgi:hypothetical protein
MNMAVPDGLPRSFAIVNANVKTVWVVPILEYLPAAIEQF